MKQNTDPTPHQHTHDHEHTHDGAQSFIANNTVLTLTLEWKKIEPVYQQMLQTLARRVKSAGFRAGKVPIQVAEGIIGEEMLKEETAKKMIPDAYEALINENHKKPITQPEFEAKSVVKGEDWVFEVQIAEKPELKIPDYTKLAKKAREEAKKAFVEEEKARAKAAEKQDPKTENAPQPAKLSEEDFVLQAIFRTLLTTFKPQVPELLLKQETRYELEEMVRSLKQLNMDLDSYLQRRGMSFDQLSNEVAVQALGRLQLDLLYSAIIEAAGFKVEESDLDEFVKQIQDEKQRAERRQDKDYLNYITPMILRQKVAQHFMSL